MLNKLQPQKLFSWRTLRLARKHSSFKLRGIRSHEIKLICKSLRHSGIGNDQEIAVFLVLAPVDIGVRLIANGGRNDQWLQARIIAFQLRDYSKTRVTMILAGDVHDLAVFVLFQILRYRIRHSCIPQRLC